LSDRNARHKHKLNLPSVSSVSQLTASRIQRQRRRSLEHNLVLWWSVCVCVCVSVRECDFRRGWHRLHQVCLKEEEKKQNMRKTLLDLVLIRLTQHWNMHAVSLPPLWTLNTYFCVLLALGSGPRRKLLILIQTYKERGVGGLINMLQEHLLCVVNPSALDKNAEHFIIMKYINNDNYSS
jgi:hypothetical protein